MAFSQSSFYDFLFLSGHLLREVKLALRASLPVPSDPLDLRRAFEDRFRIRRHEFASRSRSDNAATPPSRKATTQGCREELAQSWRSFSAQRSVQPSYATRSQRRWRWQPYSRSCAVLRCFARCVRPISCEQRACFLGRGVVPDSHSTTVQTTVAKKSSTVSNTVVELSTLERQRFPRPL